MSKEARFEFRLERWRLKLLKREAARQGMTLAEFVRHHLTQLVEFTPVTVYLEPIRMAQLVEAASREYCSIEEEVYRAVIDRIAKVLGSPYAMPGGVQSRRQDYELHTRLKHALGSRYRPGMQTHEMIAALDAGEEDHAGKPPVDTEPDEDDELPEDVKELQQIRPFSGLPRPKRPQHSRWDAEDDEDEPTF